MVRDIDLVNSIDVLKYGKLYLYGAGNNGRFIKSILDDLSVSIEGFADSDDSLSGNIIDDLRVYSPFEISHIAKNSEIIILVTTLGGVHQVVDFLQEQGCDMDRVYTIYGFFWCVYFHYNEWFQNDLRLREKYDDFFYTHREFAKRTVYYNQAYVSFQPTKMALMRKKYPVVVYQPGKVGSNTVEYTLGAFGIDNLRMHGVSYPYEYENLKCKEIFFDWVKTAPRIKMITLIREPISKDFGHFFQKISLVDDMAWYAKGIMEHDFQTSYLNYLSVITPMDYTNGRKEEFQSVITSHIDYIGKINPNGAYWGWYEKELKDNFGIDILQSDFDPQKGYTIMREKNIELLIIRLDKLNSLVKVLGEFIGMPNLEIRSTNLHQEKDYAYAYRQLQKELVLPRDYIDFYYNDNPYVRHFFSNEEIQSFKEKWLKQTV